MQERFDKSLGGLLPDGGAVLLAVSGGGDSMVMADLFLNSSLHPKVAIAHCNFHLRGEESDSDESLVKGWAESNGLVFNKKDFDTKEYAASRGISIEMAARDLRYEWFAELCRKGNYAAVAVAHNANDNAETMILNLLRGTGIKGVSGMRRSSYIGGSDNIRLIRPLLEFSRKDIHEYAVARGLKWHEDSTNSDSTYRRNCVRNEIFPLFAKINPSFLKTLNEDTSRFAQVQEIADDYVAMYSGAVMHDRNVIDVPRLKMAIHWEYVLYRLLEPYGFNSSVVEDIITLIDHGETFSGKRFYSDEYVACTTPETIVISGILSGTLTGASTGSMTIKGPGEYEIDGVAFKVKRVEIHELKQPVGTLILNLDFPFTVRHWQAGDWMRPLGMCGCKKKLSDIFGDLKFSYADKEKALVIADEGSHVLALLGYRIDESVRFQAKPGMTSAKSEMIGTRIILI